MFDIMSLCHYVNVTYVNYVNVNYVNIMSIMTSS